MTATATKPIVNMKCKRGSDQMTAGQSCPSMRAENLSEPMSHVTQFKCCKCGFIWSVPVGGFIPS